jgi:hypothetical protein
LQYGANSGCRCSGAKYFPQPIPRAASERASASRFSTRTTYTNHETFPFTMASGGRVTFATPRSSSAYWAAAMAFTNADPM